MVLVQTVPKIAVDLAEKNIAIVNRRANEWIGLMTMLIFRYYDDEVNRKSIDDSVLVLDLHEATNNS